jgi:hypothetical protein
MRWSLHCSHETREGQAGLRRRGRRDKTRAGNTRRQHKGDRPRPSWYGRNFAREPPGFPHFTAPDEQGERADDQPEVEGEVNEGKINMVDDPPVDFDANQCDEDCDFWPD